MIIQISVSHIWDVYLKLKKMLYIQKQMADCKAFLSLLIVMHGWHNVQYSNI